MTVGYGKKLRKKLQEVQRKTKKKYSCPQCSRVAVKRSASGVWACGKCGVKYASAAYEFKS